MKNDLSPVEKEIHRRTRRSFLVALAGIFAGIFGWNWLRNSEEEGGVSWPLRRILNWNGALWEKLFSPSRDEITPKAPPPGQKARTNGDIGIENQIDLSGWQMRVISGTKHTDKNPLLLTMDDLRRMPKTETVADFKCIEGWSEVMSYGGVRFSDFMKSLSIGSRSDHELFQFVGLETPDKGYYVSLDMASMLHPRTILAYELNGVPLTQEHGAPLRLIIPVKYGIKSLKRIGVIAFADQRQPDYWAEQGYDWFSGL